jgi:hypothetical protein
MLPEMILDRLPQRLVLVIKIKCHTNPAPLAKLQRGKTNLCRKGSLVSAVPFVIGKAKKMRTEAERFQVPSHCRGRCWPEICRKRSLPVLVPLKYNI